MCKWLFYRTKFFRGKKRDKFNVSYETIFTDDRVMCQPFQPDSWEIQWYNNKNAVFNIYCVTSFLVFYSFRKIKLTDFFEVA